MLGILAKYNYSVLDKKIMKQIQKFKFKPVVRILKQ